MRAPTWIPVEVPTTDGTAELAVARWGSGPRVVVCSHGITANAISFQAFADELAGDEFTLLAPDHRGRGRSGDLAGPYGLTQHAHDVAAILDHVGAETASLVGHSLGGWTIAVFAELFPERVEDLVFVDGGIPLDLPFPEGTPVADILQAVVGPALARLDLRWETFDDVRAFWQQHPALADWDEPIEAYVRADVVEGDDGWRCRVNADAILEDAHANLSPGLDDVIFRVDRDATFLWAPNGMLGAPPALYGAEKLSRESARLPRMRFVEVADVNHYTIMLSGGAKAVADTIR